MHMERQQLKVGEKLNLEKDYTIVKTIGTGASSIVYLAEEILGSSIAKDMKRYVVIKELYPKDLGICRKNQGDMLTKQQLLIPEESIQDFNLYKSQLQNAVQIQGAFRNCNETANTTMDMEAILEHNNTLYVVMGRVVGETYKDVIPNHLGEVLKICRSIAYAVGEYHKQGYLHLDIKPANIYNIRETDEIVKLFDFDTVHRKEDIQSGRCIVSCTLEYAAPEVIQMKDNYGEYEDIDECADIFSIGVILFEKIFGRLPDAEDMRPFKKWNFDESELTKAESPQVKAALTQILRKTLALLKRKRYENTDELIVALDKVLQLARNRIYLCDHNVSVTASKSYYISRKNKVEEIRERLENYHIAYLCGVGGIGKSETAREYCEKYRSEYEIIHFVHYGISLKDTIAALNFVNLEDKELSVEERYRVKVYQLSKKELYNSNMLLVIDNYNVSPDSEEYEDNVEVLKRLKELDVHILFTSRTESVDLERKICVDSLGVNELKQMFFAVNSKDKMDDRRISQVEELIKTAFYHTLTVDLVAHQSVQIERYGKKTLQDYIDVLKENGLKNEISLSVYNNKDDCEKNDVIYEHVKALFDFSALTEKERYVMVNACLVPVSGMETAEFCEFINLAHFDDDSRDADWGEDEAITKLVNGGWIRRSGEFGERICLHPVVSEVVVNELEPSIAGEKCGDFCASLVKCMEKGKDDYQSAEKYIDVSIHVTDVLRRSWHVETIEFLCSVAIFLEAVAIYKLALKLQMEVLGKRVEHLLEVRKKDVMDSYVRIGALFSTMGKYEKAMEYYEKAFELANKYYMLELDVNLLSLSKLNADINVLLGEIEEAEKWHGNILERKETILAQKGLSIVDLYEQIGRGFFNLGECQKALECYQTARDMGRILYSENHLYVAHSYNGIGRCYSSFGQHQKALEYHQLALQIIEQFWEKHKRSVVSAYDEIGKCYMYLRQYEAASDYIEKSLEIKKDILKPEHPSIADSYQAMGNYYSQHIKDYNRALEFQKSALGIRKKVFGEYHPKVAMSYKDVGACYAFMDEYEKSREYYHKALEIKEIVLPKDHSGIADSYYALSLICSLLKQYEQALEYQEKCFEIRKSILPNNHLDIVETYKSLGDCYFDLEQYETACDCYSEAVAIREQAFSEDRLKIADLFKCMGNCCLKLKEYDIALSFYHMSLNLKKEILTEDDYELYDIQSRMWEAKRKLNESKKGKNKIKELWERFVNKQHS